MKRRVELATVSKKNKILTMKMDDLDPDAAKIVLSRLCKDVEALDDRDARGGRRGGANGKVIRKEARTTSLGISVVYYTSKDCIHMHFDFLVKLLLGSTFALQMYPDEAGRFGTCTSNVSG